MDLLVLERLLAELQPDYRGRRVQQVYAIPPRDVAVVVGAAGAPRLWFSAESEDPHLYERRGAHATPDVPPGFAMAVRKQLRGRSIERLETLGGDRVVVLEWAAEEPGRLIFELIPRRSTALLVDGAGEVRAAWHKRRGRPGVGDPYEPPSPPPGRPATELSSADWDRLARRGDPDSVARGLLRELRGISGLIAREAAHRHASGTPIRKAVEKEKRRAAEETTRPRIYSPAPLDDLGGVPPSREFFLAPYELDHAGSLTGIAFGSLREAGAVFYPLRARLALLESSRERVASAAKRLTERTERARRAVIDDTPDPDADETYRRWADLLLAHPDAEVDGDRAIVPDDYSGGAPVEIPVDPSISLVDNAQSYYRKASRAERARDRTAHRRSTLERRLSLAEKFGRRAEEADRLDRLAELAGALRQLGEDVEVDATATPEATRPEEPAETERETSSAEAPPSRLGRRVDAGIVGFRSADGLDILVGRNARANDRLTHEMAARQDWWFHAEGPGSHVVVRNPEGAEAPPEDTLREAAALAAFFSFAQHSTKVNVRWTRVRHLRRPKGAPPGLVTMENESTVLAEPVAPEELFGNRDAGGDDEDRARGSVNG